MGYDAGTLTAIWEIQAARTRDEDRQDYERELAGLDIGRDARFHSTEFVQERRQSRSGASSAAARRDQREFSSRLQMLLATNPAYAQLYNDTLGALGDAEDATDRAIAKAEATLKDAQHQLEQTLNRAATLPDGTRVFRDARGNVWNERRQPVSDADAAHIEWRGNEPSYQEFLDDSEAVSDSLTHLEDLQGFRVDTLGRIRGEMMDKDNPKSPEQIERYQEEITSGMKKLSIDETMSSSLPVESPAVQIQAIVVREL